MAKESVNPKENGAQHRINDTVSALLPTYTDDEQDRADSVLDSYPNPAHIVEALRILVDVMMPGKMTPGKIAPDELGLFLMRRLSHAWRVLRPEIELALPFRWQGEAAQNEKHPAPCDCKKESMAIMNSFYEKLSALRGLIVKDIIAGYEGDPAALSYAEVQLAYPGLLAITSHRLAHELYNLNVPIVPRVMSEWTHAKTGVDIHPGASIGHSFFIDHATGVVIGETAKIGNHAKFYQGVTIGAKSFPLDDRGMPVKHVQRHPVVEDNVIVYAHATILGGDTVIGEGSTVGGNVFIMESVPPNSFVASKHAELHIKPGE
jgi:serine O-acetyltransferase